MEYDTREDLLIRVASLYYESDYNQQQIADTLSLSRSNVSRLLKEAKEKGLVEIRVRKRTPTALTLERALAERFPDLRRAMVFESSASDYPTRLAAAGQLAAHYLEEMLRPGDTLAIAWGTGVSAAVTAIAARPTLGVEVVQMIGNVGTVESAIDGPDLARQLANKLGGTYHYLAAPLVVDSHAAREMFLKQPAIAETLDRAQRARVALVGIGTTEPSASSFLRAGHITEAQLAELRADGVVGETSGHYFDLDGSIERLDINQRIIGLDLAEVKKISHVVAVACGLMKKLSILGALRGGLVNVLATDDATAAAVLEEAEKYA